MEPGRRAQLSGVFITGCECQRLTAQTGKGPGGVDHAFLFWGGPHPNACLWLASRVAGQRTARTSFVCSAVNSRCQQLRANESAPLGMREEGDGTAATHSTPSGEAGRRLELKQPPLSRGAVQLQKSPTSRLCWRSVEIIRKAYAAPANAHVREIPPRDLGRSLHLLWSPSWPSNW